MANRADSMRAVSPIGRAVKEYNQSQRSLTAAVERHAAAAKVLHQHGRDPAQSIIDQLGALSDTLERLKKP
jgi:hypothetical protein